MNDKYVNGVKKGLLSIKKCDQTNCLCKKCGNNKCERENCKECDGNKRLYCSEYV